MANRWGRRRILTATLALGMLSGCTEDEDTTQQNTGQPQEETPNEPNQTQNTTSSDETEDDEESTTSNRQDSVRIADEIFAEIRWITSFDTIEQQLTAERGTVFEIAKKGYQNPDTLTQSDIDQLDESIKAHQQVIQDVDDHYLIDLNWDSRLSKINERLDTLRDAVTIGDTDEIERHVESLILDDMLTWKDPEEGPLNVSFNSRLDYIDRPPNPKFLNGHLHIVFALYTRGNTEYRSDSGGRCVRDYDVSCLHKTIQLSSPSAFRYRGEDYFVDDTISLPSRVQNFYTGTVDLQTSEVIFFGSGNITVLARYDSQSVAKDVFDSLLSNMVVEDSVDLGSVTGQQVAWEGNNDPAYAVATTFGNYIMFITTSISKDRGWGGAGRTWL
ncbi:hypothetical protein HT576_08880 [Haloterrigena sp. SYSU A121-1]|uniref:Uncharacterized protein n=1 Tax=Haloterrigena gelatinilytica TaxID=2741724 RepID=A0A8J8GMG3_9EURY|nr:hypothetical protein [Haloterrigena gelatinilytica]NUB91134.1 hypothetical protein [Haloterrigena gelatinilytica]